MKTFKREAKPRSSGGKDFKRAGAPAGKPWERSGAAAAGGREFGRTSHEAICGECSAPCDVPFKPTGSRPVLCNKCFKKDGTSDQKRSRVGGERPTRPSFGDKRPSYRPDSEQRSYRGGGVSSDEFKILNAKLDAILRALG